MAYSKLYLLRRLTITLLVLLCSSLAASAQVLRGTVLNGTTKKPSGGDEVVLLRLDKGMEEQARTKANSRGEFSFELPDSQVMRAVRVRHQNVNYFQPVQPGTTSVAVTVYESAATVQGVQRAGQWVIFQAKGGKLQGFEIFNVRNDSQPPRTQPAFDFYLPEGASIDSATALREGGMSLKVGPVPQGGNKYMIVYPLMPGQTHFEVVYSLPYTGNLKYQPKFAGPVGSFMVFTPKSMGFAPESGAQYQNADPQTVAPDLAGMDLHVASNTGDGSQLGFQIAGEGMIPQDAGQQPAAAENQGNSRQGADESTRPGGGLGVPNERPNPLSSTQPAFLIILTLFMAGGGAFVFLARASNPGPVAPAKLHPSGAPLLDALKEEMFQLEADRVHGKIPVHEYQVAKAALDKTLQRAIKRNH
jgi:hypothetical protein